MTTELATNPHIATLDRHAARTIMHRLRLAAGWPRNIEDAPDLLSAVRFVKEALATCDKHTVELKHTLSRLRRLGELCIKHDLAETGSDILRQIAEGD